VARGYLAKATKGRGDLLHDQMACRLSFGMSGSGTAAPPACLQTPKRRELRWEGRAKSKATCHINQLLAGARCQVPAAAPAPSRASGASCAIAIRY
jgi:hypothetical protein